MRNHRLNLDKFEVLNIIVLSGNSRCDSLLWMQYLGVDRSINDNIETAKIKFLEK